jgi:hypothetical protein
MRNILGFSSIGDQILTCITDILTQTQTRKLVCLWKKVSYNQSFQPTTYVAGAPPEGD